MLRIGKHVFAGAAHYPGNILLPVAKDTERLPGVPETKLLSFEQCLAAGKQAQFMQLTPGTAIYQTRWLRFTGDTVMSVQETTLPAYRLPQLHQYNLTDREIREILNNEYNIRLARCEQSIEVVPATEQIALLLQIAPDTLVIREQRLEFDRSDEPVIYANNFYPVNQFRFTTAVLF
jgi:GntR family transcriptional regulator